MKIKKGTPCFITKIGHNNFHYPVYNDSGLTYFEQDVENCKQQSWVCGRPDLAAIIVNPEDIKNLYGSYQTVVWVNKKHLKDI
jgi:hypothetical protein